MVTDILGHLRHTAFVAACSQQGTYVAHTYYYSQLYLYTVQRKIMMGGNFDVFDVFQQDHQNLTCQIVVKQYGVYRCMGPSVKIFSVKNLQRRYQSKFPPIKILRYSNLHITFFILGQCRRLSRKLLYWCVTWHVQLSAIAIKIIGY